MVGRDPETGKFVSGGTERYDDIEVVTAGVSVGVPAADLAGNTGFPGGSADSFEGILLVDYDEIVDRNESLHLLRANHRLTVYANSTGTEDGTVRGSMEISASPARQGAYEIRGITDVPGEDNVDRTDIVFDESIDLIGRPLLATGHQPFSDTATGVGGGGSAGEDSVDVEGFPAELARFHPRDELFLNGSIETWNIADSGVHADVQLQHVYGVTSE